MSERRPTLVQFHTAVVKVQSVRVEVLKGSPDGEATLGEDIDAMLANEQREGRYPNKLTLELDPPDHDPPNRI